MNDKLRRKNLYREREIEKGREITKNYFGTADEKYIFSKEKFV